MENKSVIHCSKCGGTYNSVCIACSYHFGRTPQEADRNVELDESALELDLVDLIAPGRFDERLREGYALRLHD